MCSSKLCYEGCIAKYDGGVYVPPRGDGFPSGIVCVSVRSRETIAESTFSPDAGGQKHEPSSVGSRVNGGFGGEELVVLWENLTHGRAFFPPNHSAAFRRAFFLFVLPSPDRRYRMPPTRYDARRLQIRGLISFRGKEQRRSNKKRGNRKIKKGK